MIEGTKINLVGKSAKGKQRIQRDGSEWFIIREEDKIAFSDKRGWLLIDVVYIPDSNISDVARWVHKTNDDNFEVSYE